MASLVPGFEYDIFISYRQKDNKGDRWVSEFVEALKTELESTFKEEISVYFDINPHDGLLETHEVDASLKDKLKCLIFIPIISRTYCDPKSFAWEHELKAFVELASQDQFGLKVKLPNGNVANRILPVRIYDLDNSDIKLFEIVLGGVLRGIEFIYAEPGVNRPLKSDDNEKINLNKTKYRNQINKAGNAIKDIITAIGHHEQKQEEVNKEVFKPVSVPRKNNKTRILTGSIILLVLLIPGYFLIPKLFTAKKELEKSIAVLTFDNLSSDEDKTWFNEGITDIIINQLSEVSDLRVLGRTSTLRYREEQKSISEIGKELGVNYIIEGTVQLQANKMRISVQLIRVRNEDHIWSDIYDREWTDIFNVQSDIAQRIAEGLRTVLTPEEKEKIEKNHTQNPEAFTLYLQGRFYWNKRTVEGLKKSEEYFERAITIDPNYALAYAGLADTYFIQAYWGWIPWTEGMASSKELALRALDIDSNLPEAHTVLGGILCYYDWKWEEARKELKYAVELNPNFVTAHQYYSELLNFLGENEEARKHISIALQLDPFFPILLNLSCGYFYNEGKLKESLDECRVLQELDPEFANRLVFRKEFYIYVKQEEDLKAAEALQKAQYMDTLNSKNVNLISDIYNKSGINGLWNWLIELERKKSIPNPFTLANIYAKLNQKEEALNWLEKAFEEHCPDIPVINNSPDYDNLRSEPRFQAIIKKMGLSEYQKRK